MSTRKRSSKALRRDTSSPDVGWRSPYISTIRPTSLLATRDSRGRLSNIAFRRSATCCLADFPCALFTTFLRHRRNRRRTRVPYRVCRLRNSPISEAASRASNAPMQVDCLENYGCVQVLSVIGDPRICLIRARRQAQARIKPWAAKASTHETGASRRFSASKALGAKRPIASARSSRSGRSEAQERRRRLTATARSGRQAGCRPPGQSQPPLLGRPDQVRA